MILDISTVSLPSLTPFSRLIFLSDCHSPSGEISLKSTFRPGFSIEPDRFRRIPT